MNKEPMMSKLQSRTVMLGRGIELSYAEGGNPQGLPFLMLHGFTDSWRSLEPLAEQLPSWIRTIALSQRGHGDSAKPKGDYKVADFAQDAFDLLNNLAIRRAVVFGHCMGSLVATRMAALHPERVSALVLVGATRTLKGNVVGEEFWRQGVAQMIDPIDPQFVREFQESTLARPVDAKFLDLVVSESLKVPAHVWKSALRSMLDEDYSSMFDRITAPTQIIWGDRDSFMPWAEQEALADAIAGSGLIVHKDAGHSPHWEEPARIADEIVGWLRQLTVLAA
jgi:non-heme chloroperoxidase